MKKKKHSGSFLGAANKPTYHISGGIIPHHFLASELIADFFNQLSGQHPQTIILVGPNHYERGEFKVLTSLKGWDTPYGLLEPNKEFLEYLVET